MHTDSRDHLPPIATAVEAADQNLLLNLLENAQVSVGHLRERFISVPGYAKAIGDVACWASTPYPEVSEEEEKGIAPMLKWRKDIDAEFERLVEEAFANSIKMGIISEI